MVEDIRMGLDGTLELDFAADLHAPSPWDGTSI